MINLTCAYIGIKIVVVISISLKLCNILLIVYNWALLKTLLSFERLDMAVKLFRSVLCLCMIMVGSCISVSGSEAENEQPNIIFIFADDAGYADFGFHGSTVMKTPNLDAFAKQSMLFEQAYVSAAVCGPSRAGLLTGRYQQRFGYEENNVPGYMSASSRLVSHDMGLPHDQVTMGDYLKKLGYTTALVGKWHQGNADEYHPLKRGFDIFAGFRGGARSYYAYDEAHFNARPEDRWEYGFGNFKEPEKYLTDVMADDAIKIIEENKDKPLFLMLSFTAVHTPMEAEPEDLAQFPDLEGKRQTYAAMNLSMDRAIGRVLKSLEDQGIADNTIVVFSNDNGGPSDTNVSSNKPLSGTKANHLEGGIRVPFLVRWPGFVAQNSKFSEPISLLDLLPTFYHAGGGSVANLDGVDGKSLLPILEGKAKQSLHDALYWKKENRAAIREGDWKLIRFPDRPAQLFNIAEDETEMNDLASKNPELVKRLYKKLFEWELTLERPTWMLKREYEGMAMERMDRYWDEE